MGRRCCQEEVLVDVDQRPLDGELEEQAVRARFRPADAPPTAKRKLGLSGMEVFEAIFAGDLPAPPMRQTLDFVPIRMEPGLAAFRGRPRRRHDNPHGTVHGRSLATPLGSAVGCAVPLVHAEGKVIHTGGRQVAMAAGQIVGADGKLYTHATTTCMVFEYPSATPGLNDGQP